MLLAIARGVSAEPVTRHVDSLRDNSFMVEEAYNQEPGVVQHILTLLYQRDLRGGADERVWEMAFTQEWPFPTQKHQLSYTIPYNFSSSSSSGWGDVRLTYRYEAFFEEKSLTAVAPAISVVLPTGDTGKGFSEDAFGVELKLPFSTTIGDRCFLHLNAGVSFLPDAASAAERDLLNYDLAASIIYAVTPDLHLLVEWIGNWDQVIGKAGRRRYEFSSLLMPGVRKAFMLASGAQLVGGLGLPVGLVESTPEIGAFFYFSYEHTFHRQN